MPSLNTNSNSKKENKNSSRSKETYMDKMNSKYTYPEKFYKVKHVVFNRVNKK